jgi:hypothetical protein
LKLGCVKLVASSTTVSTGNINKDTQHVLYHIRTLGRAVSQFTLEPTLVSDHSTGGTMKRFWCEILCFFESLGRARAAASLSSLGYHEEAKQLINWDHQCCSHC